MTPFQRPKLFVGRKVHLKKSNGLSEGPFRIATVPSLTKCTLATEDGTPIENGREIDIDDVEPA